MKMTRRFFWMADKVFALHCLLSLIACTWLLLSNLPVAAGCVFALWLLTAFIWQEFKHG
jgi:hypothetical protein